MNGSCLEYIKSDCFRYKGNAALKTMILLYLKSSTFRWQVAFRLVHGSGTIKMPIHCSWRPIVVNSSATIGNNCNLSQFTTIGANGGRKRRPSVTMFTLVLEYAVAIVL